MKEIIITEPAFVAAFNCVGSECRDHCCKEWEIAVDKPTVKKYLTNKDLLIQTIAKESVHWLKRTRSTGEKLYSHLNPATVHILVMINCAWYISGWGRKH